MDSEAIFSKPKVAIIGLGYVGWPLALLVLKSGYQVIGLEKSREKIKEIKKGLAPYNDKESRAHIKNRELIITNNFRQISLARIIVVCVPTPVYRNKLPNLTYIKNATKDISRYLVNGTLVIIESTVNPGVCDSIILPMIEKLTKLKCGKDFLLAHCPERVNPGDSKWTVASIPRVLGGHDNLSLRAAFEFYESILQSSIKKMGSIKEAEACKILENTFRDINIAFVNELARSFDKLGVDILNVIDGAATKPFGYMSHYPGCGVGGHCIPVDPYYLIHQGKKNGFNHEFLRLARKINNSMPEYVVEKLKTALRDTGKKIGNSQITLLGLTYKPNVSDDRESPSYKILRDLKKNKARVKYFDPFLLKKSNVKTLDEALGGSDAVILATGHDMFTKKITPKLIELKKIRIVIDGRNCLNKDSFLGSRIIYKGIGR